MSKNTVSFENIQAVSFDVKNIRTTPHIHMSSFPQEFAADDVPSFITNEKAKPLWAGHLVSSDSYKELCATIEEKSIDTSIVKVQKHFHITEYGGPECTMQKALSVQNLKTTFVTDKIIYNVNKDGSSVMAIRVVPSSTIPSDIQTSKRYHITVGVSGKFKPFDSNKLLEEYYQLEKLDESISSLTVS